MSGIDDGLLLIGPDWRGAESGARFDVRDPATGAVVGSMPDAAPEDVRAAMDAADRALEPWRQSIAKDRARLLLRAADLLRERSEAIADVITSEQGKPKPEAVGEVHYAASFLDWFAGEAERVYGELVPPAAPDKRTLVLRRGVGVTAAITPWNFPAAMITRKLGPAIAAGCTSIAKPAEETPLTAVEVCRALLDAGLPPGVVNLVTSSKPAMVADVLMQDPRVRKLSFTGSTAVGKSLIRRSAETVTRLSLELGGHAPFIVFDDADLEAALDQVMASKFRNAGQTCICANRIFVQRSIHEEFVAGLASRTAALVVGPGSVPGVDIGPLINADAVRKVRDHVEDAVRAGARVVVGGPAPPDGLGSDGGFCAPTVLDGVTSDMRIATEETFGPVAAVTIFDHEDEVVELANGTEFGLAAYVQSGDYARVFRVAERLDFGVIGFNDGAPSSPAAPFGGVKQSGYGREGGAAGIDEYLEVKYVSVGGVHRGSDGAPPARGRG
ncbi:MAG TPA: NAD-dependent succinate-semialdehyde dehydrogenase [Solirubrobacteraceae bacterium]|nr:NAD-dependent succinate-semialdehyde dehydrogenase [Solirubrobacteraceae bacterium]